MTTVTSGKNAPSELDSTPVEKKKQPRISRSKRDRRSFPPLRGLLILIIFLAAWEIFGDARSPYYPVPFSWGAALAALWNEGVLLPAMVSTLVTFVISLVVATILGGLLGALIGASRLAHRSLSPTLEFLRAIPAATIVPIAVLLIGYEERMKVTVVVFTAIWPILLNTMSAVRNLSPILLDTAASLHLSAFDRRRKILFPSLLPAMLLGVRVAAPIALVIVLLVEILTHVSGVGALIATAQQTFESPAVFGLIIVTGIFGLLVNGIVVALEAYFFRYRPHH